MSHGLKDPGSYPHRVTISDPNNSNELTVFFIRDFAISFANRDRIFLYDYLILRSSVHLHRSQVPTPRKKNINCGEEEVASSASNFTISVSLR